MPDIFVDKTIQKSKDVESPKRIREAEGKAGSVHQLPGHTHNPLSAYCYYPDSVEFENRDPQEKVILLLRKHPITNLGWIIFTFILLIAPSFFSALPFIESVPTRFRIVGVLIWYLVTAGFVYEKFLSWFYSVNIVTDERLFDVEFVNLIYRKMTDAEIEKIQDVTVRMGGAVRAMFNYGDIIIQTAAEIPEIEFEAVPEPDKVAKILRELRVEEEQEKLEGRVR